MLRHRHGGEIVLPDTRRTHADWWWLVGAALAGPVIGVSLFQWSLATMERSALVLAIVATTPIVLIPMACWSEKDRPTVATVLGAVIAVSGVILLKNSDWLDSIVRGK